MNKQESGSMDQRAQDHRHVVAARAVARRRRGQARGAHLQWIQSINEGGGGRRPARRSHAMACRF
jgi:hypothetical protein